MGHHWSWLKLGIVTKYQNELKGITKYQNEALNVP
jgi:hypothetical protein